MNFTLETRSKEYNTRAWIVAGMNRRFKNQDQFEEQIDVICLEIASELNLKYERQDETLIFKDSDLQ